MLRLSIHGAASTNCIPALPNSNFVYNGMVTRKPRTAPASATWRCSGARRSPPSARTRTPARIGTQMARERSIRVFSVAFFLFMPEPEGEDEDADQHRHRVLVQQARLHQAHHA